MAHLGHAWARMPILPIGQFHFEPTWSHLGLICSAYGSNSAYLGPRDGFGQLQNFCFGPTWDHFGYFGVHVGSIWGHLCMLGPPRPILSIDKFSF